MPLVARSCFQSKLLACILQTHVTWMLDVVHFALSAENRPRIVSGGIRHNEVISFSNSRVSCYYLAFRFRPYDEYYSYKENKKAFLKYKPEDLLLHSGLRREYTSPA